MRYRPEIDGLRALAIAGVLGFHFPLGLKGGFLGVDVFLVISGFLMTRLLEKELRQGRFSWRGFAQRRIRRLMPALAVCVLMTLVLGSQWLSPYHFRQLAQATAAVGLLSSNFYHWWSVPEGYFAGQRSALPLLHTWSLSLEEQYYLVLPVLLWRVSGWSLGAKRQALLGLALVSGLLTLGGMGRHPEAVFYLLPTRIWQFALGGLVALHPLKCWPSWVTLGALGIVLSNYVQVWPAGSLWVSLATAVLLQQRHRSRLWLARSALVWLGRRSYSLYLWHWPVVVLANYGLEVSPSRIAVLVQFCLVLLLTEASYRWVEWPLRRTGQGDRRGRWLPAALALSLLLLCSGACSLYWSSRWQPWTESSRAFFAIERESQYQFQAEIAELRRGNYHRLGSRDSEPGFLLWGDSQAMGLASGLDQLSNERGLGGFQITRYATPPAQLAAFQDPHGYYGKAFQEYQEQVYRVLENYPIRQVILSAAWVWYESPEFRQALGESIQRLRARGCSVWLVKSIPHSPYQIPRLLALGNGSSWWPLMPSTELHRGRERRFCDFESWYPEAQCLVPARLMENNLHTTYEVVHRGESLYRDGSHLSAAGGRYLRHLFDPVLERIQR